MSPPYEAVDSTTVHLLRTKIPSVLPGVLGVYLHGSAGLGRLRPQSDVDVLVVTRVPMPAPKREQLTSFLLRASGRYPRPDGGPRPLEVTVVVHADVQPWQYPPRHDYLYGEWLRSEIEAGSLPAASTNPDLAVVIAMVLKCRAPLLGPEPKTLLDPVPVSDLVQAGTAGTADLERALATDTANVILTLARIWHTCVTGHITTKDDAATWAKAHADDSVGMVLARARDAYLYGEPHLWGPVNGDTLGAARFLAEAISDAVDPA